MSDRRSTRNHRDAIWKAFGSPPIAPSMIEAIEREFEALEDVRYDQGHERGKRDVDVEAILGAVLDEFEDRVGHPVFDREKWEAALMAVEASGRRGNLAPKSLIGHEAQPMPSSPKKTVMCICCSYSTAPGAIVPDMCGPCYNARNGDDAEIAKLRESRKGWNAA